MLFLELFFVFFKIGIFSFGGGLAMLPLMETELISRKWISISEFYNIVAVAQATPGAIGSSMATYVGEKVGGIPGSILATFSLCLPSFILMFLLYDFLIKYRNHPTKIAIFTGVKAASVSLVFYACFSIGNKIYFIDKKIQFFVILLSVISFILSKYKKIHPIFILILSGFLGYFIL